VWLGQLCHTGIGESDRGAGLGDAGRDGADDVWWDLAHAVGVGSVLRSRGQDLVLGLTGDDTVAAVDDGATCELFMMISLLCGCGRFRPGGQ
jgi:hypothetical protein